MDNLICSVEMRPDGVVVVRVPPSMQCDQRSLPDAVFSFRVGDPQYGYWRSRWFVEHGQNQGSGAPSTVEIA